MGLSELAGIGVILAVLLLIVALYQQLSPADLPRSTEVAVDLVALGLLVGIVLIIAQLTGRLG